MRLQQFSDRNLRQLSPLVRAYCDGSATIRDFYGTRPTAEEIANLAIGRDFTPEAYAALHHGISEQYAGLAVHEAVSDNLKAIANQNAACVTTGHQLCILGGPAFVIYKILSTIQLAKSIEKLVPGKKIVPVFWLASEDHDRDEINHVFVQHNRIDWDTKQTGAVGRFSTAGLQDVLSEYSDIAKDETSQKHIEFFREIVSQHHTLAAATRAWVNACFGEWGVIVVDSDDVRFKRLFIPTMRKELVEQSTYSSVMETNSRLKQLGYEPQVNPRQLNLFYLQKESRVRIECTDGIWHTTDRSKEWIHKSLLAELDEHPENFSPNVLMRPLYQETILPNVAYVGGPGELAYWLQLKDVFSQFELPMPAIVLRDAAICVSEACTRRLSKLGLTPADLLQSKSEIIDRLLANAKQDFSEEKMRIQVVFEQLAERMSAIDPTLKAAALAELHRALSGVEQLQAKAWKAVKMKEEQKLSAINRIWEEIFPEGEWQERRENLLGLAMANDKELIRALLSAFSAPASALVIAEL
jgi:bacillithiol biosynthesis cysteine-adding enzyme BshC